MHDPGSKKTIAIKLPVEIAVEIESIAQAVGSPVASLVRLWVTERVQEEKKNLENFNNEKGGHQHV